jgi:hypothetical protein
MLKLSLKIECQVLPSSECVVKEKPRSIEIHEPYAPEKPNKGNQIEWNKFAKTLELDASVGTRITSF